MKRILKWLETKFSGHSAAVEADEPHGGVESDEPGENVLNPDKCADDTSTQPGLTILKESSYEVIELTGNEVIESPGFDPYNSGSFETSKSRSNK